MELVLPSSEYKNSFIDAMREYRTGAGLDMRNEKYRHLSIDELERDFDSFVERELSHARGENLPAGFVPDTTYWLVDSGEYIGRINVRHRLNENLKKFGGHIGYDIRPGKRRQGYGTTILSLALPKAKELGIQKVLLTCDETNTASRRIIEKNGGILENKVPNPETGIDKLRYWVNSNFEYKQPL